MARNLKDKVAVVTGGAMGIGFEITNHILMKQPKVVIIVDINEEKGVEAVQSLNTKYGSGKAVFIKYDVTKEFNSLTTKILNTYTTVDLFVNNAGVLRDQSIQLSVDLNITALFELTTKIFDHMRKDKGGKGGTIINISSIYGYRINPYIPIYQGTKFAVLGFSKALGHPYNYNYSGVRVLAVCPGITTTEMAGAVTTRDNEVTCEDYKRYLAAHIWQPPSSLGRGTVEVYEKAESGTAWVIEGDTAPKKVVQNFVEV